MVDDEVVMRCIFALVVLLVVLAVIAFYVADMRSV
jgi:hypothetical protein